MERGEHSKVLPARLIGVWAALTLGFGLNFPIMKTVLTEMAPMHFRSLCLFFGAAGLFAIARAGGLRLQVPKEQWPRVIAIALVNVTGWNIFVSHGLRLMASGRAVILGYTMPMWSVVLAAWLLRERFTRRRALGVALGMGGMLLLLGGEIHALERSPLGAILVICAALTWALGTVMLKRWPVDLPTSSYTAWQMGIGMVPLFLLALFEEGSFNPFVLSLWPMLGVFYNIIVVTNFCYWAWTKIVLVSPVGVSSLSTMLTPVIGVFAGMVLLVEMPQWQDYAALCLVVAALCTVLLPQRSAKAAGVSRPRGDGGLQTSDRSRVGGSSMSATCAGGDPERGGGR